LLAFLDVREDNYERGGIGNKEEEVGLDGRNNIYEGRIDKERKRVRSRVTACGAFFFVVAS